MLVPAGRHPVAVGVLDGVRAAAGEDADDDRDRDDQDDPERRGDPVELLGVVDRESGRIRLLQFEATVAPVRRVAGVAVVTGAVAGASTWDLAFVVNAPTMVRLGRIGAKGRWADSGHPIG